MKWVAVDSSGSVIASLPSLVPGGSLRRTVGRYESQTFRLVLGGGIDPDWLFATTPMSGALIGYSGEPGNELVEWGGIILRRKRSLGNVVELTAATPEAYLDRRFTGAFSKTGRDQNLIVTDLAALATLGDARVPGSKGWPFQLEVVGAAGPVRDRSYADSDDKTIYSAISELAAVDGGPQWLTTWAWLHGPERIFPVLRVGSRVGAPKVLASAPVAFTSGMMQEGSLDEDYTAGRGANLLTATSTGTEGVRPQQSDGVLQSYRPVVEDRFTPSTSISNLGTLLGHARAKLAVEQNGAQTLSFKLARAAAPRFGVDWQLGDDVDVTIDGPAFAQPIEITGQCVGVDLDADSITPFLATSGGFDDGA